MNNSCDGATPQNIDSYLPLIKEVTNNLTFLASMQSFCTQAIGAKLLDADEKDVNRHNEDYPDVKKQFCGDLNRFWNLKFDPKIANTPAEILDRSITTINTNVNFGTETNLEQAFSAVHKTWKAFIPKIEFDDITKQSTNQIHDIMDTIMIFGVQMEVFRQEFTAYKAKNSSN